MKKKSILFKTFSNLLVLMLVLTMLIHILIFYFYKNMYVNMKVDDMKTNLNYLTEVIEENSLENLDSLLNAYAKNSHLNICLKMLEDTKYYQGNEIVLDYFSGGDALVSVAGVDGAESVLIRTKDVALINGEAIKLQLSMNLEELKEAKAIALGLLPYSLLISIVFSLLFSYLYSKKITKPIQSISSVVKEMTELKKGVQIQIKNEDELGKLADDINILYNQLLKMIESYQIKNEEVLHLEKERLDFFRGASHELKTPLAKLSILTENMKYNIGKYKDHDKYLGESLVIIQELSEMISEILDNVKNMKIGESKLEEISVKILLEKIIDEYQLIAKAKQLDVVISLQGDFKLEILPADLQKVLSNIISNAIKYGLEKGKLTITLTHTKLMIYNDAIPIPEEKWETIWKGKYLLVSDKEINSSGMGLFIVKSILDNYHITYQFLPFQNGYLFCMEAGSNKIII